MEASRGGGGRCGLHIGDLQIDKRLGEILSDKGFSKCKDVDTGGSMAPWEMKCHSIARPFKAFIPDFLPSTFPGHSNDFVHASSPIHSFELRFKRKRRQPFSEDWSDFAENLASSLPWAQLRECVVPKINSPLPTALQLDETKQMVTKPRAASVGHLEPSREATPAAPEGKSGEGVPVCACERPQNLQTIHKESRSGSFCREEHSVQLPTSPVHGIDSN